MEELPPLLRDHVAAFNAGVRTGEFGPMIERFTDDAGVTFVGAPVGPFRGREAIADAYRTRPPDDEVKILDVLRTEPQIEAVYGWRRDAGLRAGTMTITPRGDSIARLVITFDQPVTG